MLCKVNLENPMTHENSFMDVMQEKIVIGFLMHITAIKNFTKITKSLGQRHLEIHLVHRKQLIRGRFKH
jgi:hypothetical protein